MLRSRRRKDQTIVGLELDPGHIAAATVRVDGAITVERGAVAELRPGVLRDGDVADPAALTAELQKLFSEHELPATVRIGIAHQRIVARTLDLPVEIDEKALAAAVRQHAPDHIPMPMDEAVMDFQSLGVVATPAGPRSRVTIVAARRDMIERLAHAAADAGLKVGGVDLSAFAAVRAVRAPGLDDAVLYLNVAGLTNVTVASGRGCSFARAGGDGFEAMTATLVERTGLTSEHARQWMRHVGLLTELAAVEGDPAFVTATREALEDGVRQVADIVRTSLNFYRAQESAEPVESGVLTGPAVAVPGFAERLSEQLSLPIEPAAVEAVDGDPALLTVAAGLAIGERA